MARRGASSSTDDCIFEIVCKKAGIQPSDLAEEDRRALLVDEQTNDLWDQLRARIYGPDLSDPGAEGQLAEKKQLAEFGRVVGVESIHGLLSLTPDRIHQTETELENLNRKTQSLVDTLKSHNARLNVITDSGNTSASAAQTALRAKVVELEDRKQKLNEECEQLAVHADERLDRYLSSSDQDRQHAQDPSTQDGSLLEQSSSTKALQETFENLLGPHDRILEKLDALCTELRFDDSEQKAVFEDARRLSNEIIFAIVAHQRMLLDIVFIRASKSYQEGPSSKAKTVSDEREVIVADLRSLWDEVVPVAHMAVEKQLIGPIMKSKRNESDMRDQRYVLIATYTCAMLGYMNERLEEFATRIRTLVAHHKALVKTFKVFQARAQGDNEARQASSSRPQGIQRSARDENKKNTTRGGAKPATTATSTKALDDLLSAIESLGVSIPSSASSGRAQTSSSSSSLSSDLARHFDKHIQRRLAKSQILAADMQATFEATARANITDAMESTRMLAESLVAECNSGGLPPAPTTGEADDGRQQQQRQQKQQGFFADAELEKIIADEARSVSGIADGFRDLLRDINGDAANLPPHGFIQDAFQRGRDAAAQPDGSQKHDKKVLLRDPKIHDIIEKWGARGGAGPG